MRIQKLELEPARLSFVLFLNGRLTGFLRVRGRWRRMFVDHP
jgi:hypothetical protein